ncbi:hypothetical protein H0H87_007115 [Tephrocybe sp. NHM501043]|nr:hypothetical protein H0H87_007115 [Tephrocybe sp. NHM501043]
MVLSEKQPRLPPLSAPSTGRHVLVIHGGAGTMSKAGSTPAQRAAYKAGLQAALEAGYAVLRDGGEAMDSVVAAVSTMEDNPLFNSGKGAVFNVVGKNELEASIMLSKPPASHPEIPPSRRGLGVTLLTRTRNPSQLVRALYLAPTAAPHTFLSGATAEALGESLGIELVDPSYFFTEHRWREHRKSLGLPEEPLPSDPPEHDEKAGDTMPPLDQLPTGTVGAVALDIRGCIASLTSTGGRTNKLVGRVGDTPSMGSGFWAEEWDRKAGSWVQKVLDKILQSSQEPSAVGVSGTGDGDYFIRLATAATVARRVQYLNNSIETAAQSAVKELLADGGIGGVVALDDLGNGEVVVSSNDLKLSPYLVAMPLNCPGMYRGVIREDGVPKTAIFADDVLD